MVATLPLLAYAPFVVAAVGRSATFGGDQALLEMWARSALDGEAMLGPYSRFGWNHPGPALFYWYAPFYGLTGRHPGGLGLGAWVLNVVGLAAVVALVGRRLGAASAWVAASCVLVFLAITGSTWWDDTWNPFVIVVPVVVAGVCAAATAAGSRWSVPVGVGAVSFVVQTHVGAGGPVAVFAVATGVAVAVALWRERRGWIGPLGASMAVAAVMWAPPLWDQMSNEPGNLGLLRQYQSGPTGDYSRSEVLDRVAVQFTLSKSSLMDTMIGPSGGIPVFSDRRAILLVLLVGAVAGCTVFGAIRRRWFEATLGTVSLAAAAALVSTLRSVNGLLEGYLTLSASAIGLLMWLTVALTVWYLITSWVGRMSVGEVSTASGEVGSEPDGTGEVALPVRSGPAWSRVPGVAVVLVACVLAVAVAAQMLWTDPSADVFGRRRTDRDGEVAVRAVEARLGDGEPVRLLVGDRGGWPVGALVANRLELDGHRVGVEDSWRHMFGRQRLSDGCETAVVAAVVAPDEGPEGSTLVARDGPVMVWVGPAAPAPSCGD